MSSSDTGHEVLGKLTLDSRLIGCLLLAVGLAAVASAWRDRHPSTTSDFTLFYVSAQQSTPEMFAHPPGPPRGNMNPPAFQLLIRPLTWMSLDTAASVFRLLNIVALLVCVAWLAASSEERWSLADYGALLAWAPMASVLWLNQLTWIMWPLLMWTWWAWRRGKWTSGAISYGVALSLKPFLGVFLLWLLVQRRWRAAVVATASAGALFLVGVGAYGLDVTLAWFHAMGDVSWAYAGMNGSLQGLLTRSFAAPVVSSHPLADWPGMVRVVSLIGGVLIVGLTVMRCKNRSVDESWLPVIVAALLASPLGWLYYIWWMLPANRPSRLLLETPLLWVPMVFPVQLEPSGWITATVGSIYFWGLLSLWVDRVLLTGAAEAQQPHAGFLRPARWRLTVLAVIFLAVVVGGTQYLQAEQLVKSDPAIGDWVLDKARSQLPPDEAIEFRSVSLLIDHDLVRQTEVTRAGGTERIVQFTGRYDGHDVPIYGSDLETIALRRLDRRTVELTGKVHGAIVETETRRVSLDGTTLTILATGRGATTTQVFRRP